MSLPKKVLESLRTTAKDYSARAYAPYSQSQLGCAVVGNDDKIYGGCNVENAAFPSGACAEQVAITHCISEGNTKIKYLYVLSKVGWSPCGNCRQIMGEFATPDLIVVYADEAGNETICKFSELLPHNFDAADFARHTKQI